MKNKIFIKQIPTAEDWIKLSRLFNLNNEYKTAIYVLKVSQSEILISWKGFMENFLSGMGYSKGRLKEVEYISMLKGFIKDFYIEKNIPAKLLKMMEPLDKTLLNQLYRIIHENNINNNTAREILNLWVDLSIKDQKTAIERLKKKNFETHLDSQGRLGEEFKRILFQIRYPEYQNRLDSIVELTKSITGNLIVNFDHLFEKNSITVSGEITNESDLDLLISGFEDPDNRGRLIEIIGKLK
jgi:hypothetical protein